MSLLRLSVIAICLLSSCFALSVKKAPSEEVQTTTLREPGILEDVVEISHVHADDIVSDDDQSVSTIGPDVQSDDVESATDSHLPHRNFKYPVTPDPDAGLDYTTINPLPEDFNIADLHLRIENNTVQGRAHCTCGRSSGRIIGGDPARISDLPWTAALVRGSIYTVGRPYCGATLINSRFVLTASHCVDGVSARGLTVRLMQEDVYDSKHSKPYAVSRIIMHPNYNKNTIDHDIALVELEQPVKLDDPGSAMAPACLPASNDFNVAGETAIVAGWGATVQGGGTSSILRRVSVPVLSNEECNTKSNYKGRITENMMCAGLLESGGKDSCQGDSGGPLVIKNGDRGTLIGVVSWGYGCAQRLSPGVYARVARYPDWILANTRGADWCSG